MSIGFARAAIVALRALQGICAYLAGLALTVILFGPLQFEAANVLALPLAIVWLVLTDCGEKALGRLFRKGNNR